MQSDCWLKAHSALGHQFRTLGCIVLDLDHLEIMPLDYGGVLPESLARTVGGVHEGLLATKTCYNN